MSAVILFLYFTAPNLTTTKAAKKPNKDDLIDIPFN